MNRALVTDWMIQAQQTLSAMDKLLCPTDLTDEQKNELSELAFQLRELVNDIWSEI